jgi:dihydroorotase
MLSDWSHESSLRLALAFALCCGAADVPAWCQAPYDILLKQGHVIDLANRIDAVMDVAIASGRIARVSANLPADSARKVIDAKGLYVTPGLIDLHAHVFGYSGSIFPDDTSLVAGTTTVVDAGGSGWRTYDTMYEKIIKLSRTRVLVLINIVGHGMIGPKYEDDVADMDPEKTAAKIRENRQHIVGIKVAHFGGTGWTAIDRAIRAGQLSGTPVMVDDKIFTNTGRTTREKVLDKMRPGDIHTHVYNDRQVEVISRFTGKLEPYMMEARKRGVLFDLGHGGGSFLWPVATKAMSQGFAPDTISTDLHSSSILGPESDMPNCISKLMNLGMSLQDGILKSTVNPAKAIQRFPELGTLGEGRVADVALFRLASGVFAYKDAWGNKLMGRNKLEPVMTIRGGKLVYDVEGRAFPEWTTAGEYEVIR